MSAVISSDRLDLVPMTQDFLRASLAGEVRHAERIIGMPLPKDWPGSPRTLQRRLAQLESNPALEPWLLRAMVLRTSGEMVGNIGFHDAPGAENLETISPGAVEFGFRVLPAFRRQGFAHEASLALMNWARVTHGVSRFILSIRPDNVASQALAAKLGFVRIGSHMDEVDGVEDILELRAPAT